MKSNPRGTCIRSCKKSVAFCTWVSPHQLPFCRNRSISRVSNAALLNLSIIGLLFPRFHDVCSMASQPLVCLGNDRSLGEGDQSLGADPGPSLFLRSDGPAR